LPVLFANHSFIATPLHVIARLEDLSWRGNKVMTSEKTINSGWIKNLGWYVIEFETIFVLLSDASPIRGIAVFRINPKTFVNVIIFPQYASVAIGVLAAVINFVRAFCFSSEARPISPLKEIKIQP
jgi:hypothetical protein